MAALLAAVAPHPPAGLKITGSNGKGSTAAMCEAILRSHGLRSGLYTSPHLFSVHERIRLDGEPIAEAELCRWLDRVLPAAEAIAPGAFASFEVLTAVAAGWYSEQGADVVVWEAGIGGRLDATRPLRAAVTVLVNVALEHTALLGATLEAIALEKADLADPGSTLVVGPIGDLLVRRVAAHVAPTRVMVAEGDVPPLALAGAHQIENARCALTACRELLGGRFDPERARRAVASAAWPGRLQKMRETGPEVWVDAAHNEDGLLRVAEALPALFGGRPFVLVLGVSADRPVERMAPLLAPLAAEVVCTAARHKGAPAERVAAACGRPAAAVPRLREALDWAEERARQLGAVVLVTGGLFVAAEAMAILGGHDEERLKFL